MYIKEYNDFELLIKDAYKYVKETGFKIKFKFSNDPKYNPSEGRYPTRAYVITYPNGTECFINMNFRKIDKAKFFIKLVHNNNISFEQLINKQLLLFL